MSATIQARDEETLHGAFNELLNRNTSTATDSPGDIAAGLAWSQSEVRANVVHVPLSDLDSVQAAWRLDTESSTMLSDALSQLSPAALGTILGPAPAQAVHLYAGSHIEAVPGSSTLPDIITDALSVPDDKD